MQIFKNEEDIEYNSFIYKWFDKKYNKYYIGSHLGSINDSYIGSGIDFKKQYLNRPTDFSRIILEYCIIDEYNELRIIEEKYLLYYNVENNVNFYNRTNTAYGGYHKKSVLYRKSTLNENGENLFQVSSKKMVETRLKNNSYVTAKKKEMETKNKNMSTISKKISDTLNGSKWMNNSIEHKLINKENIDEYIKKGWCFGMIYKKPSTKNMIGINKDGNKKYINEYDLNSYLDDGWSIGIPPTTKGFKWINKDGKNKCVNPLNLKDYLDIGWNLGRI